jgi:phospholipid transport system substrate-binding protein
MLHRRALLSAALALPAAGRAFAADGSADTAEQFVAQNIQRGLDILNDPSLDTDGRRARFAEFLLGLTDIRRVALFLLGQYAATAGAGQVDAFVDAFRAYSLAVYQSYFAQYAGQTLRVTGSRQRAPGDDIVSTTLSGAGSDPVSVDFRVRSDGGKPVLVDIAVAGVWLALAQRAEFSAFLSRNHGDISALIGHLQATTAQYR